MDTKKILAFCLEKGFLVDKDILALFWDVGEENIETTKLIIEKVGQYTQKRIITKKLLDDNRERIDNILLNLPEGSEELIRNLKFKLGLNLNIQISKQISISKPVAKTEQGQTTSEVNILSNFQLPSKKLEVNDFVKHFRNRFSEMKNILQNRSELTNLVSINKIFGNKQGLSIIGAVLSKRYTKNKNILLEIEDMTGKIFALVNRNKEELFKKAEELSLDAIIGLKCSGNREIVFVNDIIFPEVVLSERKKSPVEEYALFIGDLHFGSKRFFEENFLKFIDYLNGRIPSSSNIEKIKYLFLVGDVITGVGNYPNQERDLKINDLERQFEEFASLINRINKNIKIIISPGNHDGVRLMEPQPIIDEKYAWPLYNLKNIILTGNPAQVSIGAQKNFNGFNVLTYHGFSFPYYADTVPELASRKAMNTPEEIMKYLLKNRHLAPTHASVQYFPSETDYLMIKHAPDIFVAGHTHKSAVSYYNNVLIISTSCWEGMTPYQEKFGNEPDHCKIPMFNLKTRAIKILDFE